MRIIDRYLVKELAKSSAAVFSVLLVLMMGNTLVKLLSRAADGELASQFIWPLLVISLANYLVLFMGLSLFFGVLIAFGRLYKDSEMAAMVACGMGPREYLRPVLALTIPVSLVGFALSLYVIPQLAQLQTRFASAAERPSIETHLRPGEFNAIPQGVFFLERYEGEKLFNAFIYRQETDGSESIQLAEHGRIDNTPRGYRLTLNDGVVYQQHPTGEVTEIRFDEYEVNVDAPEIAIKEGVLAATSTLDLMRSDNPQLIAEWQWRFSIPIGCLLLGILAFPLSYTSPRKGAFSRMGYAIGVYIVYSNLLTLGRNLLQSGKIDPWLGIWWAHVPVVILIGFLLVRHYGWPGDSKPVIYKEDGQA